MNKNILELFDTFKVVVYFPPTAGQDFIDKIEGESLNKIGEYLNCVSWVEVRSTWTPSDKAKPLIGKAGKKSIEPELRLELKCCRNDLGRVVEFIESNHPYETAEIDIYPMFDQSFCLSRL